MQSPGKSILILLLTALSFMHAAVKEPFTFKMQTRQKEVWVGEPFRLSFIFKYPIDIQIAEANFSPPEFHDFWIKQGKDVPNKIENGYHIYRLDYLLTPQKPGKLTIEPARMDIGLLKTKERNTLRFERVKWKSIFSNGLKINVKPLPDGVTLFGSYTIKAVVDKNVTKPDEPVHLTVTVTGRGNIEDIDDFNISSDVAAVYADKAKRHDRFEHGQKRSVLTQKFVFIADRNFTIPPLSFTWFDSQTHKIKTAKTAAIPIYVKGAKQTFHTAQLQKKPQHELLMFTPTKGLGWIWLAVAFLAGAGSVLLWLLWRKRPQHDKTEISTKNAIRKARSDKALLKLLLPFSGKSSEIDTIITKLEENIYRNAKHQIDRREAARKFEKYVTMSDNTPDIPL